MNVFIAGAGMGDSKTLTGEVIEKIENADIIIGAKRLTEPYAKNGRRVFFEYDADKILRILHNNPCNNACVLFSGDASFFSGAAKLLKICPDAVVYPGISCVSYFCAKLKTSCDDINIVSAHGRDINIVSEVRGHKKTFVLTGENPCGRLCDYGLSDAIVYIGENLSYENEKITRGTAAKLRDIKIAPLSVAVIINEKYDDRVRIGISDGEFIRSSVPMTKAAVRAISVSKLEIRPGDICLDIGAGTGSVSVEMALLCPKGKVYAVDKSTDACILTAKNAVKFMADNINVIHGEAPSVLTKLPRPDKLFIGGSSGNIGAIIKTCGASRVTVNAITLETLRAAIDAFNDADYAYETVQINASYAENIAGYSMMKAQNPVFVITGVRRNTY